MANLLLTCATKLTVNGTTTAPEHLMVCGNARFVNSGTNNIYMGTSHGSVDIDFNRAASQDLKIRTYSGGWNTALRILGTGVFACSYLQSPTLCATTCTITHSLRQTTNQQYICLYGGCNDSSPGGMRFMSCGGTLRGYVYYDGTSNFGLLNCSGQWAIRIVGNHSSNTCMYTCHPLQAATCLATPIVRGTSGTYYINLNSGILNTPTAYINTINNASSTAVLNLSAGHTVACTCLQSPILCATSCTNYGACATSKLTSDGDNMRHTTQYGYMQFGPGNASYAHFNTDRAQFYFNKKLVVNSGQLESYVENLVLQRTSSGTARFVIADGVTTSCQKMSVCTCIQSPVVCSTGIVRATAGCFVSSADSCFSGMIKTCCNLVVGAGGANRTLSVRHIDGKCHTSDASDTLYLQYSTGKNVIVGSGSSTSHLYTYGNIYGCGSCISTATVCASTCVVGNRFKSNVRLWDTTAPSGNNFFAESGSSGGDAFALGQGTGILDIWVKDDSVSELRSVFRANNQGNSIVIGRGCSANDNANIPVYACSCLQSPMFCATSCIRSDGTLRFTQNTPYICTGGAYIIVPGGIYVNSGTFYAENTTMHRNGICDDTATILDIWGGCDSHKCTNLRGKTFVCQCLYVHCNICLAPDTSGNMQNGISLGKTNGLPQASWGESGTKTGRIEIGLPTRDGEGGTVHHGMVHVAIDVYEYNSNDATTIIVGGHNWNCRWYNCGAHMTGGCTDKTIKLAYHSCGGTNNGRYVILLGECDSSWTYGSVHVRSITNGLYYCDNMNLGTPWYVKRVTCADSHYNQTTADLRSTSNSMAGYQCAMVCFHGPRVCATTCLETSVVCGSSVIKSADWVCAARICSTACILTPTCVHGGSVIATNVASIHTGGASCCGLAVGQTFSNEGGWHNQLNTYGSQHNIIRIKKAAGDASNNAQCLSLYVHNSQAATIISTGNLLLKAAGGVGMCLLNGAACSAVIKGSTCVVSPMVFPTGCLQFDQSGTRSWKVCASSGNLNFHSGDGSGTFYFHSQLYSNILCGTSCVSSNSLVISPTICGTGSIQTHSYRSGANNMCLCPSGCGYGIFFGPGNIGEKQHWTTSLFTASGTQARRAKLLEFVYNTHHWDSGGSIFIDIYHNYFGKGSHQRWQVIQTGLDGTGSQDCSAGADLPAGARDVALILMESNGPDAGYFKLHLDMHAAGYKVSDYDAGIAEVYLDVDYYAQVAAKVTMHGTWTNINTGASFTGTNKYKFYNSPASYTNISAFHNAAPTVPSTGGRILFADKIYGRAYWQACCQNCYTNVCTRYLDLNSTSCMSTIHTSSTICGSGLICANSCLHSPIMCFSTCLCATAGCIKVPIIEGRYSNGNTNYRGGICWNTVQLGNNGQNKIIVGATAAGGYLDIITNNTADHLGGTSFNGCHTARFCSNGYSAFCDWIQVAPNKGIYGTTNSGHFYLNGLSDYGTWTISGARNNWNGIYMCGMTVMAKCDCSEFGLYNDVDNEWMVYASRNGETQLRYNGVTKLKTLSGGTCSCGCLISEIVCAPTYMNSGKFCAGSAFHCNGCSYVNGRVEGCCHIAGSSYFCNNCLHVVGNICSTTGVYGDGSNLSGISAGIDGCSFQGAVGTPSGCNYERTTNVRLGTCALANGKGVHSTGIGNRALEYHNCSWHYGYKSSNTAIGADAQRCSLGLLNTSVGWMALRGAANNNKCYNVGIGTCVGYLGLCGNNSIAIGNGAARYQRDCTVAIGAHSDAGNESVMIGFYSGANDGTAKSDTAVGHRSLYSLGCGCHRIAIGHCAGYSQGQWNHKEKYTIAIGACALACGSHTHDAFNYNIVIGNPHNSCAAGQCLSASTSGCMILGDGNINNACICAACTHVSTLNKSSGSFRIKHPNPSCSNNRTLYHSFVESPNEGDNIYRWQVETSNCVSVVTLPNYYRYLNKNDMVWVSPYRHFGSAYGEVTADQCCLIICSNSDGCFNVLLVGTRKDSAVSQSWKGVERDEEWTEPCYG